MVNYKKLRFSNITTAEYRHLFLLLYWPIYAIIFFSLESLNLNYMPIESGLDYIIPFCEYFAIFYYLWYFALLAINLYTLAVDIRAFKRFMYFIIIANTLSCIMFAVFPSMQMFRPTEFERDNFLVDLMKGIYLTDTNTNVCPSLHVVDSFAILFAAWNCKGLNKPLPRVIVTILSILMSVSTVFVKQHSVIDVVVGAVLSFAVLPVAFILPDKIKKRTKTKKSTA